MSELSAFRIGPFHLRDLVWLASLVAAMVGGYVAFEQRLTVNEERIRGYSLNSERMGSAIEKLNHFTTATEEIAKMNERRISSLEANYNILSPKLERIDTNIQWLTQQPKTPKP